MLLLLLSFNFSEIKSIYNFDNEISFPKYEKAWEVITHNFDRSNEVLMGVAVQNSYYLQKSNITNRKEINLKLSDKGMVVLKSQEIFQKEIFNFAVTLYDQARPEDRDLVKKLFLAISSDMEKRVKAL